MKCPTPTAGLVDMAARFAATMPLALCFLATIAAPLVGQSQRTVTFGTQEGTWISVDVSPNGDVIVFDLLGDLYVLPAEGGIARPLLTGPAFVAEPVFSPDGRSIAFISDESGSDNVWIMAADGSQPRPLSTLPRAAMNAPTWTPDGRAVVATVVGATAPRTAELWRFDVATGVGARLVENSNGPMSLLVSASPAGPHGAAVSPDGRWLYYASITPRQHTNREGARSRLVRRDLGSGREEPVAVEAANPVKPRLSPDGTWLGYAGFRNGLIGLKVKHLRDGEERWLRMPLDRDDLEAAASRDVVPRYAFTPDSKAIIVSFGGTLHRIVLADGRETPIPFQAEVALTVRSALRFPRRLEEGPVVARFLQYPSWSRDGRLAFSSLGRIYVADGRGQPRRLTTDPGFREFEPVWAPDGRSIAYLTWDAEGGHLWRAPADRVGPATRLSSAPAFYADLAWSPDGQRLVFLRAPLGLARADRATLSGGAELAWMPASGGAITAIGPAGQQRRPHFGPDPNRIITFSPSGGLMAMGWDGSGRTTLARVRGGDRGPLSPPGEPTVAMLSPDGRSVALLAAQRLLRLPLPSADSALLDPTSTTGVIAADGPEFVRWLPNGSLGWVTGRTVHTWTPGRVGSDSSTIAVALPRAKPLGTVVLTGARIITMRGDEVVERGDLVIRDNRITAVGPAGAVVRPAGARIVDVAGATIMPGLIDIHAHWDLPDGFLEAAVYHPRANLAYGVTTVRDPQTSPAIFNYADLAEAGAMPSPRIFSTGPGLFMTANYGSLDDARRAIRRYRDRYGTWLLKSYAVGNRQQRQWVVAAAAELGMMPTAEGLADTKQDLTHAIDGMSGNEHALPSVPLYRDVVELFAQSGITYTPTLLVSFGGPLSIQAVLAAERPWEDSKLLRFVPAEQIHQRVSRGLWFPDFLYRHQAQARAAAAIVRAGGRVALGGHGEMQGIQNHWEMKLLAMGMTPREVLRAATMSGAEALGLEADLGSLEPGKMADLIILNENPLEDIRHMGSIRFVMKNGVLYDGNTLDLVR